MIRNKNIAPDAKIDLSKINTLAGATVAAKTATADLTIADFDKVVTNTGSNGTIVLTLPAANLVTGKVMKVQVTAAQIISLSPVAADGIFLGGSGVDDKDLNVAGVIGNYADIYSDGVNYFVSSYSGVVTKEA